MHRNIAGKIRKILKELTARQIRIAVVILLLCITGIVYLSQDEYFTKLFGRPSRNVSRVHEIKLTEEGFTPSILTIARGDTVLFRTTRGKPFWPASDLHPTHDIYLEFDPKEPIEPDKSWSFMFEREGEWRYHDHLYPLFQGSVRVTTSRYKIGSNTVSEDTPSTVTDGNGDMTACYRLVDSPEKQTCFSKALEQVLARNDIASAFDILAGSYTEDTSASDCHALTHRIGEQAYQIYVRGGQVKLDQKTLYCGYGFYHGFMETLIQDAKDMQVARDFCKDADEQISRDTVYSTRAEGMCYHGIGHGFADGNDPRAWGNPEALIAPALNLCRVVSANSSHKASCASGVFNSLANMYFNPTYRLTIDEQDPYWLCARQETPEFKQMCYEEMNTLVLKITDYDFARAMQYAVTIKESVYRKFATKGLATFYASFSDKKDFNKVFSLCGRFKDEESSCLYGFALGLVEHGSPKKEFENAFVFCGSEEIRGSYAAECFQQVLNSLAFLYTKDEMVAACKNVKKEYLYLCALF